MKIIVIGASGFLGTKLVNILSQNNEVIGADARSKDGVFALDATNSAEVTDFIKKYNPDAVIDTVALTSSMACEKDPELAYKLNYLSAKNIADACRKVKAKMIFISSTYLFDGVKGDYTEEDKTFPMNQYARTKILAEKEISRLEDYIIIRVDVMYGFNGLKSSNGVFNQILSGKDFPLRDPSQMRQPVLVDDVARVIEELIKKDQKGIFHVAGTTRLKMMDFLKSLEEIVRTVSKVRVSNEKPEIEIKIPKNATLNISKIMNLGINTHSLKEGIEIIKKQYNSRAI